MSFRASLEKIAHLSKNHPISIGELVSTLGTQGHLSFLLLLVLPFLQPIPFPGVSSIFGILIFLIALQLTFKRTLWVPSRYRERILDAGFFSKVTLASEKLMGIIERVIPWSMPMPRPLKLGLERPAGICIAAQAVLLSLPLPIPLSNFFPAISIFFLTLGLLEEEGVFCIIGGILWIVSCAFFIVLAFIPWWVKQKAGL